MLRVGLVGAGGVGTRHAETLLGFDDVEIAAVADPDQARARQLAERCGAQVRVDAHDLVEHERVDALYVCVPPFAHGPPEDAALEAGLPLFVEKPLAADLPTAEAIAERVAAAGVPTAVGYHWRYLDTVGRAQALLTGRPVRLALLTWLGTVPPVPWWSERALSGGQIVEQTTHLLDLARLVVGEVTAVTAVAMRREEAAGDIDDATSAVLRFASGAVGALTSTSLLHALHRASLTVVADGVVIELSEQEMGVDDGSGPVVTAAQGSAKTRLDRDFVDVVAGRAERVRVDYAEALRTHRLGCAITDA